MIYPEFRNHLYLRARDNGDCETMTGSILLTAIFLDDAESRWTEAGIAKVQKDIGLAAAKLTQEASTYGAKVKFYANYRRSHIAIRCDRDDVHSWASTALKNAGLPFDQDVVLKLERKYNVKEAPLCFFLNKRGRAYSLHALNDRGMEGIVVYAEDDADTIRHELLHVFGAMDYYFPDAVTRAAEKYFPDSVMLCKGGRQTTDSLTAYLVGWTNLLSAKAKAFLQETAFVTKGYLDEERKRNNLTGRGTKRFGDAVYTGDMVNGVPHGKGCLRSRNGICYEGNFIHGVRSGQGKETYPSGATYVGNWNDNGYNGHGTYLFSNGDKYVGEFKNSKFQGRGTLSFREGGGYIGDFYNGDFHGQGTYKWPNGDYFVGSWRNGKREGAGKYVLHNGVTHSGYWRNGEEVK